MSNQITINNPLITRSPVLGTIHACYFNIHQALLLHERGISANHCRFDTFAGWENPLQTDIPVQDSFVGLGSFVKFNEYKGVA